MEKKKKKSNFTNRKQQKLKYKSREVLKIFIDFINILINLIAKIN